MSDWRILHEATRRETDEVVLEQLVYQTEDAIYHRLQELAPQVSAEVEELNKAFRELVTIKSEKLGWPDPLSRYDIFTGDPKESPVWLASLRGIGTAYEHMKRIAAQKPGRYFLFDPRTSSIVRSMDTSRAPHFSTRTRHRIFWKRPSS